MSLQPIHFPQHGAYLYESKHKEGDIVKEHHHNVHQILYGIEGEGTITLDGRSYTLGGDMAALLVPYSPHSVVTGSKLTLLVLAFDVSSVATNTQKEWFNDYFAQSTLIKMSPSPGSELRQMFRKILFEQLRNDTLGGWAIHILLMELLLMLVRSRQASPIADANMKRAERIRTYIDTHYFEPITTTDLASRMNMSGRYVNNLFKEQYKITPLQYLAEVRIGVAKKLLAETNKDIVSVCFEVGYETVSTFYRVFKNLLGVSPNHFRQTSQVEQKKDEA